MYIFGMETDTHNNSRRNPGPEKRGVIRDAYEFALTRIGHDKDSGEIWMDYIQFLRAGEVIRSLSNILPLRDVPALTSRSPRLLLRGMNSRRWTPFEKYTIALCRSR